MKNEQSALILLAHGARDPRWAEPFLRLQTLVQQGVASQVGVHLAFLELMTPRLPELIAQLESQGVRQVRIVPIFLGQGGHVRRDLPELVEQLQQAYPAMGLTLATAIGENELVLQAIAGVCIGGGDDGSLPALVA